MSFFQLLLLVAIASLAAATVACLVHGWVTRRAAAVALVIWLGAALAVAWPDATSRVARAVGIGRGADLALYASILVMMVGFFMVYLRLRRLQRNMTLLVRQLALMQAQPDGAVDESNRATEIREKPARKAPAKRKGRKG